MIVCMYSPLGREAVAAHRLTFRKLYVCNGDWRWEEGRGCGHCEKDIVSMKQGRGGDVWGWEDTFCIGYMYISTSCT